MKAIITVGCSGSGKSTFAQKMAQQGFVVIERDAIRKKMKPKQDENSNFWSTWDWKLENAVTEIQSDKIINAAMLKINIVISDTNLNRDRLSVLKDFLSGLGYEIEIKLFDIQYKKLLENDLKRADSVGQQIIAKQYMQFMQVYGEELGYKKHDSTKPDVLNAIVVDIDGTLALHTSDRSPYDYERVGEDSVCEEVREIVNRLSDSYRVFVVSGRDEVCRHQTVKWMHENHIMWDELHMRPTGSKEPDFIVKNKIFQDNITENYNVKMWFDDRPVIVRLAHVLGVKCFSVANPFIEF